MLLAESLNFGHSNLLADELRVLIVRLPSFLASEKNEFSLRMSNEIWFVNLENSNIFLREDHLPNVART